MKRILITGGAGFIGSKLVKRLLAENNFEIAIIDNLHPQVHGLNAEIPIELQNKRISFFKANITDSENVRRAIVEFDPELVIHLASETGTGQSHDEIIRYSEVNVIGTAVLLDALKKHGRHFSKIILSSSRAVYGEGAWLTSSFKRVIPKNRSLEDLKVGQFLPRIDNEMLSKPDISKEDDPVSPVSIYASTKLQQEYLVNQYLMGSDAKSIVFRFQNVYGPGQSLKNPYTGVLSIFSSQILTGNKLNIFEDGNIGRDFVYIDDVIDALVMAIAQDLPHGIILNVGSGQRTTILSVAKNLLSLYGASLDNLQISAQFRLGDVRHALSDNSFTFKCLGWRPQTELTTGLKKLTQAISLKD